MPPRKTTTRKRKADSPPLAVQEAKKTKTIKETETAAGTRTKQSIVTSKGAQKERVATPPQLGSALDNTLAAFSGKFDVYTATLPFIYKFYRPADSALRLPDYKATYDTILKYQAKPDYSIRIVLDGKHMGRLESSTICHPYDEEPLTAIMIESGKVSSSVQLDAAHPGKNSLATQRGDGYVADLSCDTDGCFSISGSGRFTLRHVWQGEGDEALYEGSMLFETEYGEMLESKGFGSGETYRAQFWAVRALKDEEGEEIGIEVDGTADVY